MPEPGDREVSLPTSVERPARRRASSEIDTEPTAKVPPARSPTAARSLRSVGSIGTSFEAIRNEELHRARVFYVVVLAMAVGILPLLPFMQGDATAKWAFAGGIVLYVIVNTWFVLKIRDPAEYRDRNLMVIGLIGVPCGFTGVYFWGVFSPAPAMIAVALYVACMVSSRLYARTIYALSAGLQIGLAALVMTGAMRDPGLLSGGHLDTVTQLATQGMVQFAFLATFAIARMSKRALRDSVTELERAVRGMAQREALFNEVRQELERSAWVGGAGRYTDQIVGDFKLGVVIGRGAMGEVYEARALQSEAVVAVKLLHRAAMAEEDQVERFAREARAASAIDSPHVCRVLAVSGAEDGVPYIAMERMRGEDLGSYLRRSRRMPIDDAVDLVHQVARGLEAAREAGVVHRDLKPHNLFLDGGGTRDRAWKILDFGVSKLAEHGGTLTKGNAVGTPSYMSPEQARGEEVDHRSDVYSLGAIAYRALTGQPPFAGRDVPLVMHQVVYQMPARPGAVVDVPPELDAVLAVALAKRAKDRFESARELAAAFAAAATGQLDPRIRDRATDLLRRLPWRT